MGVKLLCYKVAEYKRETITQLFKSKVQKLVHRILR